MLSWIITVVLVLLAASLVAVNADRMPPRDERDPEREDEREDEDAGQQDMRPAAQAARLHR